MNKTATFLFLIFSIGTVLSQSTGNTQVMSLEDCMNSALTQNFDIQLTDYRIKSAEAGLTNAFGSYLPSVSFNMGYYRQLNIKDGTTVNIGGQSFTFGDVEPNSYSMSAIASMPIFDGFSREATYSTAQHNLETAMLSGKQTVKSVKLRIYQLYVDIIRNMQFVKTYKENLELGKKELERINALYNAGIEPVATVYAQEADLGQRELELVNAENNLKLAKSEILKLMGMNPELDVEFLESSLPNTVTEDEINGFRENVGSFRAALKKGLNKRLDYRASQSSVKAAESTLDFSRSGYYPSISASGGWSWNNSTFDSFNESGQSFLRLDMRVPIFENFSTNSRIQSSKLQLEQRIVENDQAEQQVRNDVKTSFLNLEASEKQIEITARALRSAKKNYESASERFKAGAASITELNYANNQLVSVQINRINAIYSYFRAQKNLLYSIGELN